MKKLLALTTFLLSFNALAFVTIDFPNLQFGTNGAWSKGKVKRACGVNFKASDKGVMSKRNKVVVYTVYSSNGIMLAQATAKNSLVWTKAVCK